mgnify:CR=1 FL=1
MKNRKKFIVAIDQGTTSSRAILFNTQGKSLFKSLSLDGKFTLGDLFHMPIKDEQFDIVFNQGVMEHFRLAEMDASAGVEEMMRVVKKNGTLVILVPAFFSPLYFVYKIFKALNLIEKYWPYTDQDFLHKHELYEMMEKADCKNITVKRLWSSFFFSIKCHFENRGLK